jgi:transcriptional regulator with XRE-family HTH domain
VAEPELSFAGLLRQLRTEAKLTQEELAEAAGLSPRSISDLERGVARTAHKDTGVLLAGALSLPEPARELFVAAARGKAPAAEVLAASQEGGGRPAGQGEVVVPRQLPAGVGFFAGRDSELKALDELLDQHGDPDGPGAVVVTAVGGWPEWAKRRWRCTGSARSPAGSPTGNCM